MAAYWKKKKGSLLQYRFKNDKGVWSPWTDVPTEQDP
jgi:hypothetical protein